MHDFPTLESRYREIVEADPNNGAALQTLVMILAATGPAEVVEARIEDALPTQRELVPESPELVAGLRESLQLYAAIGRCSTAEIERLLAVSLQPEWTFARALYDHRFEDAWAVLFETALEFLYSQEGAMFCVVAAAGEFKSEQSPALWRALCEHLDNGGYHARMAGRLLTAASPPTLEEPFAPTTVPRIARPCSPCSACASRSGAKSSSPTRAASISASA